MATGTLGSTPQKGRSMSLTRCSRALVPLLVASTIAVAPSSAADATSCKDLATVVSGTVGAQGENIASIDAGWLKGTLTARFTITGAIGDAFTIESVGTIATKHGAIDVRTTGTLSYTTATTVVFAADGPLTGGDGKYAHATGHLNFTGSADLGAGTFTETIDGDVCRH